MTARTVHADPETADRVRGWVEDAGHTLYTILGHVTSSGMSRDIGVRAILPAEASVYPGHPFVVLDLDYNVAGLTGSKLTDRGVRRGGCGMDMGFDLIYSLARVLYPDGHPCWGKGVCQSNDHVNPGPGRDIYNPATIHRDGGYGIRQVWL